MGGLYGKQAPSSGRSREKVLRGGVVLRSLEWIEDMRPPRDLGPHSLTKSPNSIACGRAGGVTRTFKPPFCTQGKGKRSC